MFNRRGRLACLLAAFALSPWLSAAAPPPAEQATHKAASPVDEPELQVDEELLEFLGTIDSEDGELIDYYAKTDSARRRTAPASSSVPAGSKVAPSEDGVTPQTTRNHE